MNNVALRRSIFAVLGTAVCAAVWMACRSYEHVRWNDRLIEAANMLDVAGVGAAIRHGAELDVRESRAYSTSGDWWEGLLFWRERPNGQKLTPLQIALSRHEIGTGFPNRP